jgi:hypothetical protein
MPSKTPSISHFFLFIAGMISIHSANAAAPRNLPECEQAYFTAVSVPVDQRKSATVQSQLKSWCTSQCVTEKINIYAVQENKPVTDALRTQLTPGYTQTCTALFTATTTSTVATGTPTTGTGSTATLPECTWNLPPGVQPAPDQQNICQQAIQRKQAEDQRKAAAAAEQQRLLEQQQAAQRAQRSGTNTMLGAAVVPQLINSVANGLGGAGGNGTANGNGGQAAPSGPSYYSTTAPQYATGSQATAPRAPAAAASPAPAPAAAASPSTTAQPAPPEVPPAQALSNAEAELRNVPPELQEQGRGANTAVREGEAADGARRSIISQNAEGANRNIASQSNEVMTVVTPLLCNKTLQSSPTPVNFPTTYGHFKKFLGGNVPGGCAAPPASSSSAQGTQQPQPETNTASQTPNRNTCPTPTGSDIEKFNARRACECGQAAESAEAWCVESDAAKKYRTVMDAAGPLLLGLNAVAKSCGGMHDISKFVGSGLTAVNGICIAKKMQCESRCAKVLSDFSNDFRTFDSGIIKDFMKELDNNKKLVCDTLPTPEQKTACVNELITLKTTVTGQKSRVAAIHQGEQSPQSTGTVPSMIAKCAEKARNIAGMLTNIGAIALAAQKAKKCEKEHAAAGTEGVDGAQITANDYCSNEATSNSVFCKCKGTPSAEGCAAVLAAGPSAENNIQDQRGVNLQSGRGPSAFAGAGGKDGSGSMGGYRGSDGGSDGTAGTQTSFGAVTSSMGAGSGGSVGGFTGAGGPGAASSGSAASDAKAKKEEDKAKWSFGSIASSVGSSFGFGGGGGSRGDSGTSALPADQQAMIERKLASDRYAAEISPSTGADNFSKIKRSYVQKADTFMGP